jgi:ATP-dependent helicase HepA
MLIFGFQNQNALQGVIMSKLAVGQRWISEMEPELGLGLVIHVEHRRVRLQFALSNVVRQYAVESAPIRRVRFNPGDRLISRDKIRLTVESVSEMDGILIYQGGGHDLVESSLSDTISFSTPEERLRNGHIDPGQVFDLRYESVCQQYEYLKSPVRGFIGGRIDLVPHQFYIAHEICSRQIPRVFLADEVGLGKTIEACLIIHRLLSAGRIDRVLILVPPSLVHQWFVEMLHRFNLSFCIADEAFCRSCETDHPGANPFLEKQLILGNIEYLVNHPERYRQVVAANWDLMVVDEAHHLKPATPPAGFVARLAVKTQGVLLLSATPEQMGPEGHFSRLRLLDPDRYHDFEEFSQQARHYARVAGIVDNLLNGQRLTPRETESLSQHFPAMSTRLKDGLKALQTGDRSRLPELIRNLLDQHGIGRVLFRNTRKVISGFPQRVAHLTRLSAGADPSLTLAQISAEFAFDTGAADEKPDFPSALASRIEWLVSLLRNHAETKFLLICRSKTKALAISDALHRCINVSSALFHEDLSLVQRDRNAVWFAEEKGAQLLICSEIGSEGRNFQFAQHLVLFDLPLDPELLEQRIGRLDRIGQTQTIHIHIPFVGGSALEVLARWYHEALDAFEHPLPAGHRFLAAFGKRIRKLATGLNRSDPAQPLEKLIQESRSYHQHLVLELQRGRDRLLEQSSFDPEPAHALVQKIRAADNDPALERFMLRLWEHFGIHSEALHHRTYRLEAGGRFDEAFPHFGEGMRVSFQRKTAMVSETTRFLTQDHPMVRGAIELLTGSEKGNSAFAVWEHHGEPSVLLEAIFVLEAVAPVSLHLDRFLPPTPVRVLVDHLGRDCTAELSQAQLSARLHNGSTVLFNKHRQGFASLLPGLTAACRRLAEKQFEQVIARGLSAMKAATGHEIDRLRDLKQVNPHIREEEIVLFAKEQKALSAFIGQARPRLDALRLILKGRI